MATNKRENEEEDNVVQKRAKVEEESENGGDDAPFVSRRQFTICFAKTMDQKELRNCQGLGADSSEANDIRSSFFVPFLRHLSSKRLIDPDLFFEQIQI